MPILIQWTLIFFLLALIAGALGLTGVATVSGNIAGVLLVCVLASVAITALYTLRKRRIRY